MPVFQYHSRNVLLADDDPLAIEFLAFALERADWNVAVARDGNETIDRVFSGHFAIVILDINMPFLSGLDILEAVHNAGGVNGLSILMLSAQNLSRDRERAEELGAEGFISKPIDIQEVLSMMARCRSQEAPEN